MARRVLVLCGYPGAGKDVIASHLVKKGWDRVAFADPVRHTALTLNPHIPVTLEEYMRIDPIRTMQIKLFGHDETERILYTQLDILVLGYGWDTVKREIKYVRELLQKIGTEAGRDIHGEDCWVNIARRRIFASQKNIVITDCRFPNEIEMARGLNLLVEHPMDADFDVLFAEVRRDGVGKVNDHRSEQMNYSDVTSVLIENNGTLEDLFNNVDGVIENEF